MKEQTIVSKGVDYFIGASSEEGLMEVSAYGTINAVAAVQDLNQKGYTVVMEDSLPKFWPMNFGQEVIFYATRGDVSQYTPKIEAAPVETEETSEPDWEAIEKMSKDQIEDEADKYSIQLSTSLSKAKMITAFKEAYLTE